MWVCDCGQYEDRDDGDESTQQPAPPPPANNATTFPALGGSRASPAPEPVKTQQPQSTQPPQSSAVDPAVLQMGPTAPTANNAAPVQVPSVRVHEWKRVSRKTPVQHGWRASSVRAIATRESRSDLHELVVRRA